MVGGHDGVRDGSIPSFGNGGSIPPVPTFCPILHSPKAKPKLSDMELPDYYTLSVRVALNASLLGERGKSTIYACFQEMKEMWNRMNSSEKEETRSRVGEQVQHFKTVQEILERPPLEKDVVERILLITK